MTGSMTGRRSAARLALKLVALVVLMPAAGCYTYSATTLTSAAPGTQARLRLDDEGFVRVANQAAMNGFPVQLMDSNRKGVVGRIVEVGPSDLIVEIRGIGGSVFTAELPIRAIEEFAVRSFSRKRTLILAAAGVVLSGTLASGTFGGTTSQGGGTERDNSLVSIPLLTIPFR